MAVSAWNPDFWVGRRVWLSGHTGFKGSWLALWLLQWGAVLEGYALDPEPADANLYDQLGIGRRLVRDERADLADQARLMERITAFQPEVVFHLAAQPLVRRSYADPVGTWSTNVLGSLHLLEALKPLTYPCAVVMVTTDKVYANQEWPWGYREVDRLGGHDPYSASKAGAELAIASWRSSFIGTLPPQTPHLAIATARAGNVIGGGDGSADRLFPDCIAALQAGRPIAIRNPAATRPWQHVLEPLAGYLLLAEHLHLHQLSQPQVPNPYASSYNFGPSTEANRPVHLLVEEVLQHWPGTWLDQSDPSQPHEAGLLHLVSDKAQQQLGWRPRWDFTTTVERTVSWYRQVHQGQASALVCCLADLEAFQ